MALQLKAKGIQSPTPNKASALAPQPPYDYVSSSGTNKTSVKETKTVPAHLGNALSHIAVHP